MTLVKHQMRDFPSGSVVKTPKLPMQGPQVQSLVGEVRSHMPCGVAKKKSPKHQMSCAGSGAPMYPAAAATAKAATMATTITTIMATAVTGISG